MSKDNQFKQLERMAYLSYQQDGIIDLLVGWATLSYGLNIAMDTSIWTYLGWLPIVFYIPLKNRITVPRLGYVKFDPHRGRPSKWIISFLILGFLALLTLGMVVFLLSDQSPGEWIREYTLLFYGLLGVIGFSLAGLISGINRLLLYALLSLLIMGGGQLIGVVDYIPFFLLGGSIFAIGAVLLTRFIRRYPIAVEGG